MMKQQLQDDLKTAMLAREAEKVEVLKSLKSAVLYAEVAANKRDDGLTDQETLAVYKKESKKRQDAVELFARGGNQTQSDKEQWEKDIIDTYLPAQLGEDEINKLIDTTLTELGISSPEKSDMGRIIGATKSKGGTELDGAMLAKLVQARLA